MAISVANQIRDNYRLEQYNRALKSGGLVYDLSSAQSVTVIDAPTITHNGKTIRVVTVDISISEGSYGWTSQIKLADPAAFVNMQTDDPFTLHFGGENYSQIVDSKSKNRPGPGAVEFSITGVSPTAKYVQPRTDLVSKTWDTAVMARTVCENILGVAIDWRIVDWSIPGSRLAVTDSEPLAVVLQIAEAAGGVVESKADGTVVVRAKYPVTVPQWQTAAPDHIYTDAADNITINEVARARELWNKIVIRDFSEAGASDSVEYEADANDNLKGTLTVYPKPYRNIEMVHTGGANVGLAFVAEEIVDEEEQVEFKAGVASVQYPIYTLTSVTWQKADLGAVTWNVDQSELTVAGAGYSLATIKYKSRIYKYNVEDTIDESVQFLVCEV